MAPRFIKRSLIGVPAADIFDWHKREGALERLTPPWESVRVLERSGGIGKGARVVLETRIGPLRKRWVAEHVEYVEGSHFRDIQIEGPFALWEHTHRVEPEGERSAVLEDEVRYELPGGRLGRSLGSGFVRRKLDALFEYRHRITRDDLLAHAGSLPMRVAVTGASGLLGSRLLPFLRTGGHAVVAVRRATGTVVPDTGALGDPDAVVHLAGENIASGRWTAARKARIRESRIEGTRHLAEALARLPRPPRVLVCASAVGYYGDRGAEELDESSAAGAGFLAEVCRAWEEAAAPARDAGIRVVHLRFGVVLSPSGGALRRMLAPFRIGAGGAIGSGRQYMPWVAIEDAVGAIHHAILSDSLHGPVNAVSPQETTNARFAKTLARVLRRPALLPVPAFAARLLLGEIAEDLLLASARVRPRRLLGSGYAFRDPDLETALRRLLGRAPEEAPPCATASS